MNEKGEVLAGRGMSPFEIATWPHGARGTCVPGCPVWSLCHCGCGMTTSLARQNAVRDFMVRGRPRIFVRNHARAVLRYQCRGPFARRGVPTERVAPLVRYLISAQGGNRAKAARVYDIAQTTLFKVGHRGGMVTPRIALRIAAAVKAHEAALRREAVNPATMERRHHRGNHVEERDLDCHLCAKAAVSG